MAEPVVVPMPEGLSYQQTSQNSSIDSFESFSSLSSHGTEIRRVRTLPIPQNLFYVGMQHQTNPEEDKNDIDIRCAMPCSLREEFWFDALKRAESHQP
jgi:hypothetical protein